MKTFFKKRTIKRKYEDTFECRRIKMKLRRLLLEAELWIFKLRRHFSEGDLNFECTKTPWRCRNEGCKLGLANFTVTLVFQWQKYKDSRCGEDFQRQNYREWRYEDIFQEKNYKMKIWRYIRIKDEDTKTTCGSRIMKLQVTKTFSEGDQNNEGTKTPWRWSNEGCKLGLVNFNVTLVFQWQKYNDSRCGEDFQRQNYREWRYEDIFQEKNYKMKIWRYIPMQKIEDEVTKTTSGSRIMKIQVTKTFFRNRFDLNIEGTKTPWR